MGEMAACFDTAQPATVVASGAKSGQQERREASQNTHDWECSRYDEQFYKTKLCSLWKAGSCRRRRCRFAHGEHELQRSPDLSKTALCRNMQRNGACEDPQCKFAHDLSELRATEKFFKTTLCSFSRDGSCKMGELCRHAHSRAELRSAATTLESLQQTDDMNSDRVAWKRSITTPAAVGRQPTIREDDSWRRSVTSPAPGQPQGGEWRGSPMRLSEMLDVTDSDFDDDDDDLEGSNSPGNRTVSSVPLQQREVDQTASWIGAQHQMGATQSVPAKCSEVGQQIQNYQMWVRSMSMPAPVPQNMGFGQVSYNAPQQPQQLHQPVQQLQNAPQLDGRCGAPAAVPQVPWSRSVSVPAAFVGGIGSSAVCNSPTGAWTQVPYNAPQQAQQLHQPRQQTQIAPQLDERCGAPDAMGHVPWARTVSVPAAVPQVPWCRSVSVPAAFVGGIGSSAVCNSPTGAWTQAISTDCNSPFGWVSGACNMGPAQPQQPMGQQPAVIGGPMNGGAGSIEQVMTPPMQRQQSVQQSEHHDVTQPAMEQQPPQHQNDQTSNPDITAMMAGMPAIMAMMPQNAEGSGVDSFIRSLQAKMLEAAMPEVYED